MNEQLIVARGKYELLKDEITRLCSRVEVESREIERWISRFSSCNFRYMDRVNPEKFENSELYIDKINSIKLNYDKITLLSEELHELAPLLGK